MSNNNCRGWVEEKDGLRPCKNQGNAVLANGYCRNHQYYAVFQIMEKLKAAELELIRLEKSNTSIDPNKITRLKGQINQLQSELDGAQRICSQDKDCSNHLKELLVSMREITSSSPMIPPHEEKSHPITRLKNIEATVNDLAVDTSPEDANAFDLSQEWELAQRRRDENLVKIPMLKSALSEQRAVAEGQERKFQQGLQSLTQQLRANEKSKAQAEQVINSLQKRIDRCMAESKQVGGVYSESITKLQQEAKQYKDLYNNMVGREIKLSKSIQQLQQNEKSLQQAMEDLKASYERKISQVQTEFAEQASAGGTVLSEREAALTDQVNRLKADLEQALEDLKVATTAGKDAINQALSSQQPYGELARELKTVNDMLRVKNEELGQLQSDADHVRDMLANKELACAQNIDRATAKDRAEMQRMGNRMSAIERELAGKQQEIVTLQTAAYDLRRQNQNEVQRLQNQLRDTRNQLLQTRNAREAERRNLKQQYQLMKNQEQSAKLEMDFKYKQLKDQLNERYMAKASSLQEKFEANRLQLDQERRNLQIAQKQIQESAEMMNRQKSDMEKFRDAYESKMADFLKQKDELNTALSQAQEQAQQFSQIENDYKKRIDILRQTVAVQRQRYEAQINMLNTKLRQAITNRNSIMNSIEKCNAARDSMVQKVNMLSDENARLKDMYLQMKSRMDVARSQYEAHLEKLRADANRMQTDIRTCAQRLQDASLVHDHVKRMKDDAQKLRLQLEDQIRQAKGNEQAMRRLLKDRELEKQQVFRLQSALRECGIQRSQSEGQLKNTNTELREVKRMHGQLAGDIRNMSSEYQQALESQEAAVARERFHQETREAQLQRELAQLQLQNRSEKRRVQQLQGAQQMTQDVLANTEIERARQIQMLVDAQKLAQADDSDQPITGRSSLVQT